MISDLQVAGVLDRTVEHDVAVVVVHHLAEVDPLGGLELLRRRPGPDPDLRGSARRQIDVEADARPLRVGVVAELEGARVAARGRRDVAELVAGHVRVGVRRGSRAEPALFGHRVRDRRGSRRSSPR